MTRRAAIVACGLSVWGVLLAWYLAGVVGERRFQGELRQAERDLAAGRYGEARSTLRSLTQRRPGRGDIELHLGACEILDGHVEEALAAWGRVPDHAPEAAQAALSRGRVALDNGRFALAERCLARAALAGGAIADEARRQLSRVYWKTGQRREHRLVLERLIERLPDPSEELRLLWNSESQAYPIGDMREQVGKALQGPPDDRVWLAAADLAIRDGKLDEALEWLARCEHARPDDAAVWNARLDWAQAADRPEEARRAASHLAASSVPRERVAALLAWLASRAGDRAGEVNALEERLRLDPSDAGALERLADLAAQSADCGRVADLRRRKAAVDAALDRYRLLIAKPDLSPLAADLARGAEGIGRRFEATAWWELAARRDPAVRPEAEAARRRLGEPPPSPVAPAGTLADLLPTAAAPASAVATGRLVMPHFEDEAARRGLVFSFDNGKSPAHQLPETMSGGVGVLDFDGDGWLDVYAVQGGPFPPPERSDRPGDRLFRNKGGGEFDDVTTSSGLPNTSRGYGHGVAVGDYDNDGRPDLFVTRWHSYALYHNLGGGRFEDATARAGFAGDRDWPTSAAWADLDGDGDLDLYVCHYLAWDADHPVNCTRPGARAATYCDPREFPALPDHVFRNDDGRFVDVSADAAIVDRDGRGLGVVAADLDGDGKVDVFVANDTSANLFFRNLGGMKFSEDGLGAGLATNAGGGYMAGMGLACGDLDGDGRIDLAVTNFFGESTTFYHSLGAGLFADRTAAVGLAVPTRFVLGFGLSALDANDDGRLDLVQANGHVNDLRPTSPFMMTPQLFLGGASGRFSDESARAGPAWQPPRVGRGLAVADLDNDGRLDILVVSNDSPLALFRNEPSSDVHFLTLALEGTTSNRDAVGARVEVTAGGRTQVALRFGGGSYLSAGDPRLHFGLGPATKVERIDVAWPSGQRDRHEGLAADAGYLLREGGSTPRRLGGFAATR
jgi:tetratricopeptide (TPR) repeat protein